VEFEIIFLCANLKTSDIYIHIYQSLNPLLLSTVEIKRSYKQTQATQISLIIYMKAEAAVCMVAKFIHIKCSLQLVYMGFSLLPYLSVTKLIIWFFQVHTWILLGYALVTEYVL
jgi:hypothetical protein